MEVDHLPTNQARPRFQFSIRSMLILMTVTAVCLAGLLGGPRWLATITFYLLVTAWPMVLTTVLVYGRDWARTFCLGALFPSAPLLLMCALLFLVGGLDWGNIDDEYESRLHLAGMLFALLTTSIVFGAAAMYVRRIVESPRRQVQPTEDEENFTPAETGRST